MIDHLITIIIVGIATWRLSYAITNEDVFHWLRRLFGVRVLIEDVERFGQTVTMPVTHQTADTFIIRTVGALLSCVYCASFWVAIIMWGLWMNGRAVGVSDIITVFAIAGVAAMIQDWRDS